MPKSNYTLPRYNPTMCAMRHIVETLAEKFRTSVSVDTNIWCFDFALDRQEPFRFSIWMQSGGTRYHFTSWEALVEKYYQLMEVEDV